MTNSGFNFENILDYIGISGIDLVEIAKRYGTPIFVFSESKLVENLNKIKTAFHNDNISIKIFYACKANSNLTILQLVKESGIGIEVSSSSELQKAALIGFDPKNIIFNGPAKTTEEIELALDMGIYYIGIDSESELFRLLELAKRKDITVPLCIRVLPGVLCGTKKGLETGVASCKFGLDYAEVSRLLEIINDNKMHLNLLGFHMHIGSQVPSLESYGSALDSLLNFIDLFPHPSIPDSLVFNLGGGFPVQYLKYSKNNGLLNSIANLFQANLSVETVASKYFKKISEYYQKNKCTLPLLNKHFNISLAVEPGRSIVANTAILISRVVNFKLRGPQQEKWLFLDAGFNILLESFSYKWFFETISVSRISEIADEAFRICGPLCDGSDVFFDLEGHGNLPNFHFLPHNTNVDDYIGFLDVGAYTLEQMTTYNGRCRASAVMVCRNGEVRLIRKRESFEDLIATDIT